MIDFEYNMDDNSLMHVRREYLRGELLEENLLEDPHRQFRLWLENALRSGIDDPNAMSLATASSEGNPSVRIVLLKDAGPEGLAFFTNYKSRKGDDLEANPRAAALFFWPGLERQIRVEGNIIKLSVERSDEFFNARSLESRVAAIISDQSRVIPGRSYLEEKYNSFKSDAEKNIDRPEHWGGYLLKPVSYEFCTIVSGIH